MIWSCGETSQFEFVEKKKVKIERHLKFGVHETFLPIRL